MRVHELAKKYDVPSKELVSEIQKAGFDVKSHMSSVEEDVVAFVEKKYAGAGSKAKKAAKAPAKSASKKAVKEKKPTAKKAETSEKPAKEIKDTKADKDIKETKEKKSKKVADKKEKSSKKELNPEDEAILEEIVEELSGDDKDEMELLAAELGIDAESAKAGFERIENKVKKREKNKEQLSKEKEKQKDSKPKEEEKSIIRTVLPVTVKGLATKMNVSPNTLISKLLKLGIIASMNHELDEDTVVIIAEEFGFEIEIIKSQTVQQFSVDIEYEDDKPEDTVTKAPVVTFMGHVDHGKTSLLDSIRKADVASGESGGITQHTSAYEVMVGQGDGKKSITFIDTPGHEAFTAMRARGADMTDICVLVVAADDGVMPQTIEAINHIKAAGVAIVVALNKVDRPNAQVDKAKTQLMQHGLNSEEWGGDTIIVETSAISGQGIDELLEMILLQAEMLELKANPNRKAKGAVVEAKVAKGKGSTAMLLVQNGTLKIGDFVVCGLAWGKIKAMIDDRGVRVKEAGPAKPVEILGLNDVPMAGDTLYVVDTEKEAKYVSETRIALEKEKEAASRGKMTAEDLYQQMADSQMKELKVIVKADVQGSIEAVKKVIGDLKSDEVKVTILHGAVGAVNESDIVLARASKALIIAFKSKMESPAISDLAKREGVIIRFYDVIYEIITDVRNAMEGMLEPEQTEIILGHAQVRQIFKISKLGSIAGCMVQDGKVFRNAKARVKRGESVLTETTLASLKRHKDEVKEVPSGAECGIRLTNYNDFEEGDVIELFKIEETKRVLG